MKYLLSDRKLAPPARCLALAMTAALGLACGSEATNDSVSLADAASSGSGGQGGSSGGNGSGGNGPGGSTQAGGASGSGGEATDAKGPSIACRDDGGMGLASAARHCAADADCQIVIGPTCCGADSAFGVAKAQVQAYASCVGLPPGACQGLGCAKFLGYLVDTGEMTVFDGQMSNAMSQVAVHCKSELCTTSIIPLDAGRD
jgi:hypothetical protein